MGDLISRKALLNEICKNGEYHGLSSARRWNALRIVALIPAVDAVPRDEYEALLRRFRHLLQSDFIRRFDEVDPNTGEYVFDIALADKAVIQRRGEWLKYDDSKYRYCSSCKNPAAKKKNVSWHNFCPICGAEMKGCKEE